MLDFTHIITCFPSLISYFQKEQTVFQAHLKNTQKTWQNVSTNGRDRACPVSTILKEKYTRDHESIAWPICLPFQDFTSAKIESANLPYGVLASDGSNIDLSRDSAVPYYLLNLSQIALYYGKKLEPILTNQAELFYRQENISYGKSMRERPYTGTHVALERDYLELKTLWTLVSVEQNQIPILALSDGSLIRWTLSGLEEAYRKNYLKRYLTLLENFKTKNIPLLSYISQPNSSEVINLLRLAVCPYHPTDCNHCAKIDCQVLDGIKDRDLFSRILKKQEFSAIFTGQSQILEEYGENKICFVYLNTGEEIVRVEFPIYLAYNNSMLAEALSYLYDQILKGTGYPVALREAHEQAVITMEDRTLFSTLLEQELRQNKLPYNLSAKNNSKMTKNI